MKEGHCACKNLTWQSAKILLWETFTEPGSGGGGAGGSSSRVAAAAAVARPTMKAC